MKLFLEDRAKSGQNKLSVSLGLTDLLGYGVGCTVGAGIYSQIGVGVGLAGETNFVNQLILSTLCTFITILVHTIRVSNTGDDVCCCRACCVHCICDRGCFLCVHCSELLGICCQSPHHWLSLHLRLRIIWRINWMDVSR